MELILMTKVVSCLLLSKELVKLFIFHLLIFGLVRHVFGMLQIFCSNLVLSCYALGHFLHMVVVILHERSHCKVNAPDDVVLVLITVDLISVILIEIRSLFLIQFVLGLTSLIMCMSDEWLIRSQLILFPSFLSKNSLSCHYSSIVLPFYAINVAILTLDLS